MPGRVAAWLLVVRDKKTNCHKDDLLNDQTLANDANDRNEKHKNIEQRPVRALSQWTT